MKPEQQRKILEAAAKACGIEGRYNSITDVIVLADLHVLPYAVDRRWWNPITNSADTASMCAKLEINTFWWDRKVECVVYGEAADHEVKHNGTPERKEAAWRLAASMVAAKVGGYEE